MQVWTWNCLMVILNPTLHVKYPLYKFFLLVINLNYNGPNIAICGIFIMNILKELNGIFHCLATMLLGMSLSIASIIALKFALIYWSFVNFVFFTVTMSWSSINVTWTHWKSLIITILVVFIECSITKQGKKIEL